MILVLRMISRIVMSFMLILSLKAKEVDGEMFRQAIRLDRSCFFVSAQTRHPPDKSETRISEKQ